MLSYSDAKFGLMTRVFELALELEADPEHVALAQALTLNKSKPQMGLLGSRGLFGSEEWWANIRSGAMPLERVSGVITRAYHAGQDSSGPNNAIDLVADEGLVQSVGIYVNDPVNVGLFQPGHAVAVTYALDELKPQAAMNSGRPYSKIALEMAVSLAPVK